MTRWPALVLTAVVASLASAASAPDARARSNELVPTIPWEVAVATPAAESARSHLQSRASAPLPSPALPAAAPEPSAPAAPPAVRRGPPDLDAVGEHWYERQPEGPQRLYLERLLDGEVVHDSAWQSDPDALTSADDALPSTLSFGVDGRMERTTARDENGELIEAVMLGPKMTWRPSRRTQIDVTQLVAVGAPYALTEVAVAFVWKY